jgi:hypothetical protein
MTDGAEHMGAHRLGYANTTKAITSAIGIRVVPVTTCGKFTVREDLEVLLLIAFDHTLPGGSSGQVFETLDSLRKTITYLNRAVKVSKLIIFPAGQAFQKATNATESYLQALKSFLAGPDKGDWVTVCRSDKADSALADQITAIQKLANQIDRGSSGTNSNQRQGSKTFVIGQYKIAVNYTDKAASNDYFVTVDTIDKFSLMATINAKHPFVESARRQGQLPSITQYALVEAISYDLASRSGAQQISREMREHAFRTVGLAETAPDIASA